MFKKFEVVLMITIICFLSVGCYSVKMTAPTDADVKLMPAAKASTFRTTIKSVYAVWGLIPVYNAFGGVRRTVKANNLTEVRFETKQTFVDMLISLVLGAGLVSTYTTIIDGNSDGGRSGNVNYGSD